MFGLGYQELLILLIILLPIIGIIVALKRGRVVPLAACVGFLQGLANIVFALFDPFGMLPQDRSEAAIDIVFMLVQGVAMITAAVATYRSKRWGGYLLLIVAVIADLNFIFGGARSGWLIPVLVTVLYAMAVRALRRTPDAPKGAPLNCP